MISHVFCENNANPSIFYYIPNFLNKQEESKIFQYLEDTHDFIPNPKFNEGISRLQKWYHVDKKYFCPVWKERYDQWNSFEFDQTVSDLIDKIQKYIKTIPDIQIPLINSCLINKYPTGDNFISPHRDSPISFGSEPTIIGLSLGTTRTIQFERVDKNQTKNFSFELESGSLFIMAGSSQNCFTHSIKKSDTKDVRYSLTFREFIL